MKSLKAVVQKVAELRQFNNLQKKSNVPWNEWGFLCLLQKKYIGQDTKTFNSNDLVIGWDYRNNGSGFEGNLGAIFFYNSDLSNDQVNQNYNATKSRYGH